MAEARVDYFEVVVPFDNIRSFSTSLHLLQKVGKDITFDVEDTTITLRALNDLKSSFASIEFTNMFFEHFLVSETYKSFSCRLAIKPICAIFRNIKNVRTIRLTASMVGADHELAFQMELSNGITRTHRFKYSDCEIMNALFEEEDCSYVRVKPRVFAQILDHLHQSPEVAIEATAVSFSVRSFHKPNYNVATGMTLQQQQQELKRHMNTGLSVSTQEFEVYQFREIDYGADNGEDDENGVVGSVVELIFCLREVNAFLGFCEALDLPDFDFHFSQGGRAIKYSVMFDGVTVALVLATIESQANRALNQNIQQERQRQQQLQQLQQDQDQDQSMSVSVSVVLETNHEEERDDHRLMQSQQHQQPRGGHYGLQATDEADYNQTNGSGGTAAGDYQSAAAVVMPAASSEQGFVPQTVAEAAPVKAVKTAAPKPMNRRKRLFEESSEDDD